MSFPLSAVSFFRNRKGLKKTFAVSKKRILAAIGATRLGLLNIYKGFEKKV
jgi:hypothetical protein